MKLLSSASKHIVLYISIAMLVVSSSIGALLIENPAHMAKRDTDIYEDITVTEAYALLTDTSNGIQNPIDVRTTGEWRAERINTPYPEFSRHFALSRLSGIGIQEFITLYEGNTIILYCQSGGRSKSAAQILSDNGFNGTLYNMMGGITAWKKAGYPIQIANHPPTVPSQPSGPVTVQRGYNASYTTKATDQDGNPLRYGWDWDGNGTIDEWTSYHPSDTSITINHTWRELDSYQIRVKCQDNVGNESEFSSVLTVIVMGNNAPDIPVIDGPLRGKKGKAYDYTFTIVDPDGDNIYLWIDWGGTCPAIEWIGPYNSGDTVSLTNTWNDTGTYTVRAKTKDIYDEESDWGTLEVTMPLFHKMLLKMYWERLLTTLYSWY
jgi:rhodanese-related sulfurtransferase